MQVLVVSQYFWPEDFRINELVLALRERGIEVDVLTGKPNYPSGSLFKGYRAWGVQKEYFSGTPVFRIPLIPRGRGKLGLALNYISFVASGLFFAPLILRQKKYDVVFVYAPSPILQAIPAIFLGWLKSCPVAVSVQDLWPESLAATGYINNRLVLKIVKQVVKYIYRGSDLLLVQSLAFVDRIKAFAIEKPIKYLPNSIDESFLQSNSENGPDLPGLGTGFSILFAGNIGHAQAVDTIIEAAIQLREHDDINFVVMGDGSRRDWMQQQIENFCLTNVHLPGRFPIKMMPNFMRKASVLLVTLANQEVFHLTIPAKLQAYLAVGRPILASLNGEGARLVNEAAAGLTSPAGDGKALATAVLQMYSMPLTEREKMGVNGHSYYLANFKHDMIVNQLIGYLEALSRHH